MLHYTYWQQSQTAVVSQSSVEDILVLCFHCGLTTLSTVLSSFGLSMEELFVKVRC